MLYVLTTGVGDGSLTITVDGFGSFGDAIGFPENTGAIYDPIGPIGAASTTFQSGVAVRLEEAGPRQFLTSGDIQGSGGLADPVTTGTPTSATSTFMSGGLSVELVQTASLLLDDTNTQQGSILTQRYVVANETDLTIEFELIRYIDGDLLFDGSLVDGGGRLISAGREFLFETDAGGTGETDTTFLGLDATGGTIPLVGRFELDSWPALAGRIIDGIALDDTVSGDLDGDGFIDVGQEYDVTLALRNVITLEAGGSVTYTTRTVFGSGNPEDIPIDPLIEVAPVMQLEGDSGLTAFVFTLSLTQVTNSTLVVDYTTLDGSAIAPADYEAQSGTLTFEVGGPTTQTITINVVGDELIEPNETFFVRLFSVGGGDSEAVGTILNDDVDLSINDVSILEGDAGTKDVVFTVSAVGVVNTTIRFNYTTVNDSAVAGSDYLARGGFGTLPRGASSARITVPIIGDRFNEATETFFVALVEAEGARLDRSRGTATIIDNDLIPNLYVNDVQVTTTSPDNDDLYAVFTVALDAPSGREVVVEFATSDGTASDPIDYTQQVGFLTFTPGTITRSVAVQVFTDGVYTSNRHFFLNLMDPLNAHRADPQGTATIVYADEPIEEPIVDNGSPGYSETGSWTHVTNTLAYGLDYGYHAAGNGGAVATWTWADIPNGSYQVFARWSWFVNWASNAPYTILDGTTPRGTVLVNQQIAPVGDFSNGISWQELGTFEITSGNLAVQLTNDANGFVIADAVRIVRGGIAPQEPEMDVAGFEQSIDATNVNLPTLQDGTDFGQVRVLTDSMIHTFTVTNSGNADLHLTGTPQVTITGAGAADFWIVTQPADVIAPTEKTTFQLMFHPSQSGLRTAVVAIANDDDSEHPYTFTVQGTGGGNAQSLLVMDDAMPGFSQVGNWTASASTQAYDGHMLESALGQDSDLAVWEFTGLAPGTYHVYTTWVPAANRSTDTRFAVSNLTDHTFTATVNQRQSPSVGMHSTNWANLGVLDVSGGSLRVSVANSGKGVVVADAVMIVRDGDVASIVPYAQNAALPQDVNGDRRVSPIDALIVINNLLGQRSLTGTAPAAAPAAAAARAFTPLDAARTEGTVSSYFIDVNADGRVSPVDALMVINYLLARQAAAPSAAPLAETSTATDPALTAVAVDRAIVLVDELAEAELVPRVELVPPGEAAGGAESLAPLLLEPAGVESLLSAESEEEAGDEDTFDPLLLEL